MTISEFIETRRKELNLTLEEIGNATGVGKSTVKKWESGFIANMGRDKIRQLALILEVSPTVFIDDEIKDYKAATQSDYLSDNLPDNIIPMPKMRKIPLLGTIACGTPILAQENIEDDIDIPDNIKADFALRCKGDSMINARINDGDVVYIKSQPDVNDGEIAAVLIDDEATLKRVYKYPDQIVLQAENPAYKPMTFNEHSFANVRILGKAVAFTSLI